jgi:mRNA interferase MazF
MTVEPLRGEVWDVFLHGAGIHPALVMSVNAVNARLRHVAIIPITGTLGPGSTHIPLERDAGLTKYDESYVDITGIRVAAKAHFRSQRGRVSLPELAHVEQQLSIYLGLKPA